MKSFFQNGNVKICLTHQGKSIVAEPAFRTLKNKIYKYMSAISKNVFIDKLQELVGKYNNNTVFY